MKKINECEGGVPGGCTLDSVGGMGAITFPSGGDYHNPAHRGSGDIPLGAATIKKSKKKKKHKIKRFKDFYTQESIIPIMYTEGTN